MTDPQLTAIDLAAMTYQEIETARTAGRLDRLLGVPDDQIALIGKARTGRLTADDTKALWQMNRPDLIELARADNRIDYPNTEGQPA